MAVWYLDSDDEITDAVARLRNTTDRRVVFVVPAGSRIATGRINFRLLAKEAASRDLAMAVASSDEQVRSLALAAGVLTLPTADEAEAALERGDVAPPPTGRVSPEITVEPLESEVVLATTPAGPSSEAAIRARRRRLSIGVFVILALLVLGAVTSLETLPTADITLTPRTATIGPVEVIVTALTTVEAADAETGQVPAVEIAIPLEVEGTFQSSGIESVARQAAGVVSFSSEEQTFDQSIAAGTRVQTPDGVAFQTVAAVVLPRSADGAGPSEVLAPIEAVETGPEGNVMAGAITVVASLESQGIAVTNPEPTTGGDLKETPVVTRADYDQAAADLTNRLGGAVMDARLREPDSVPAGLTLFPETRSLGAVTLEPEVSELVGQSLAEFTLRGVATAQAVAVDEREVAGVAIATLMTRVPDAMQMLPDSIRVDIASGAAVGQDIEFSAVAVGDASAVVDREVLVSQVAGLPISEAQAILGALGSASVTVWPDFLSELPRDPQRITLEVQEPAAR